MFLSNFKIFFVATAGIISTKFRIFTTYLFIVEKLSIEAICFYSSDVFWFREKSKTSNFFPQNQPSVKKWFSAGFNPNFWQSSYLEFLHQVLKQQFPVCWSICIWEIIVFDELEKRKMESASHFSGIRTDYLTKPPAQFPFLRFRSALFNLWRKFSGLSFCFFRSLDSRWKTLKMQMILSTFFILNFTITTD